MARIALFRIARGQKEKPFKSLLFPITKGGTFRHIFLSMEEFGFGLKGMH